MYACVGVGVSGLPTAEKISLEQAMIPPSVSVPQQEQVAPMMRMVMKINESVMQSIVMKANVQNSRKTQINK
eukprot:3519887-Karenia_brevis.AAC.1